MPTGVYSDSRLLRLGEPSMSDRIPCIRSIPIPDLSILVYRCTERTPGCVDSANPLCPTEYRASGPSRFINTGVQECTERTPGCVDSVHTPSYGLQAEERTQVLLETKYHQAGFTWYNFLRR